MKKTKSKKAFWMRSIAVLLAFLCTYSLICGSVFADFDRDEAMKIYKAASIPEFTDEKYASADTVSGQLIISGNGTERVVVGNLVKLMTLLIVFEKIDSGEISLTTTFPVTKHAQEVSVGKVRVYLDNGKKETIRVEQAIEAVCINGAQDAACALAEFIGGNEEQFVALMNTKALTMKLKNTLFTDSTGINTDQYTCAEDMALIMAELVGRHPACLSYLNLTYGMFKHESTGQGETEMVSSNPLNRRKFYEGSDGSMLGYSKQDNYSIACTAAKDEKRVVSVILGEEDENARAAKVRKLAEYSLSNFTYAKLCSVGTFVKKVSITEGKNKKIRTETASDLYVLLNVTDVEKVKTSIVLDEELKAPIEEGIKCGYVSYFLDDVELGRVELRTAESMERANWFVRLIRKILAFFGLE
ncbi:MAG: D-alanyl-D-alanine carboxypeptidase [Clostridia bacterium]|nr:D-alanyl-D-alanine carboxypeptidase [Clostridia bacterium]